MSNHKFADTLVFTCTLVLGIFALVSYILEQSNSSKQQVIDSCPNPSIKFNFKDPNDPFNLKYPWK